jgi:uncharacterized membrane protein
MPEITPVQERRTRSSSLRSAFLAVKAQHAAGRTRMEVMAERLTMWASSTWFLLVHAVWFLVWIVWNTGVVLGAWDPFPFGLLTMIVSLEAIFLSIFVLMTQQRESAIAELREELSLQVSLRIEEEVTKSLHLLSGLYTRLGQTLAQDEELRRMLEPLDPSAIERDLVAQINAAVREPLPGSVFAKRWRPRARK